MAAVTDVKNAKGKSLPNRLEFVSTASAVSMDKSVQLTATDIKPSDTLQDIKNTYRAKYLAQHGEPPVEPLQLVLARKVKPSEIINGQVRVPKGYLLGCVDHDNGDGDIVPNKPLAATTPTVPHAA